MKAPRAFWTIRMSEISAFYETIKYPGGEYQARLREDWQDSSFSGRIRIIAQALQPDWLIKLALLRSIFDETPAAGVDLIIPYLPYARADRRFVRGDCFGLQALGRQIDAMQFDRVYTLDAHSAAASERVSRLIDVPPVNLIYSAISRFADRLGADTVNVIFPDEGARKRYSLPDHIGPINIAVAHCSKRRDAKTGKLLGFDVPKTEFGHALIVDDICDGGGTFLGIAEHLAPRTLGLYVTHGIFSQGFSELKRRFDVIYTTDSFGPVSTLDASVFDSIAAISGGVPPAGK